MCGIGCILESRKEDEIKDQSINLSNIQDVIRNRGPNSLNTITKNGCLFIGSVLHIQGPTIIDQPYIDADGNILLWNGEVFSTEFFVVGLSDTVQISNLLNKETKSAIEKYDLEHDSKYDNSEILLSVVQSVAECLSLINGPYAFIYYHKSLELIIYGRDPFGRRSLLALKDDGCTVALSSVWATEDKCKYGTSDFSDCGNGDKNIVSSAFNDDADIGENNKLLWEEIPVTGIFACSVQKKENEHLHTNLLLLPGRIIDSHGNNDIFVPWPSSRIKLGRRFTVNGSTKSVKIDITENSSVTSSSLLLDVLLDAVRCRVASVGFDHLSTSVTSTTPNLALTDPSSLIKGIDISLQQCRVGVLFSGGIDSVVLAALLHLSLLSNSKEPIDLLNVAFTGKKNSIQEIEFPNCTGSIHGGVISSGIERLNNDIYLQEKKVEQPAPDRLAAIAALGELQRLFPTREWRLVHIDVSSHERQKYEEQIKNLIRPRDTHMDLNIGTALWFASRGQGYLKEYTEDEISSASTTTDSAGRPLVRAGGDEFARSVGLSTWKQKKELNEISSNLNGDMNISADLKAVGNKKIMKDLKCANLECRLQSKESCIRMLCKRCCNQSERDKKCPSSILPLTDSISGDIQHSDVLIASKNVIFDYNGYPDGTYSSSNSNSVSSTDDIRKINRDDQINRIDEGSGSGLIVNQMVDTFCPVHKSSAKELEKMRANEKRRAERLQGDKLCLSCQKINCCLECKRDGPGSAESKDSIDFNDANMELNGEDMSNEDGVKSIKEDFTAKLDDTSKIKERNTNCNSPNVKLSYTSTCRALLIGIGADEQMAGYGRHRTTYLRNGLEALEDELDMDCTRLWERNLGRDDRCVADHGRDGWFPYLDERVVSLLQSLPMNKIADLSEPPGIGDKKILRSLAFNLGLKQTSLVVKRAIQFGTRVAKHTNVMYHGSNRKGKGQSKI